MEINCIDLKLSPAIPIAKAIPENQIKYERGFFIASKNASSQKVFVFSSFRIIGRNIIVTIFP